MMGPDALGRLIDEHAPALILYARQWCAAPEDVVQEAFIKLCREQPPPEGHGGAALYPAPRTVLISSGRPSFRRSWET